MPRNGSGQFSLVTNSWNEAVNGQLASAGDWQALINDVASALTQSVSKDGQTPFTGNLNLGGNKITGLTAGSGTGQALIYEQLFNQGTEADLASSATTDIGAQLTNFLRITGTTTITSFGTNYKGPRFLRFAGAVLLTNSATLSLPGGANITTAAGDCLIAIPTATLGTADGWKVVAYQSSSVKPLGNVTAGKVLGRDTSGNGAVQELPIAVDTSGNVGIGTSSPSTYANSQAPVLVVGTGNNFATIQGRTDGPSGSTNGVSYGGSYSTNPINGSRVTFNAEGSSGQRGSISFYTKPTDDNTNQPTERARIDSSGNLLVGTTSATGNARLAVKTSSTSNLDYGVYVANSGGAFLLGIDNNGGFATGTAAGSPYNATTASAANVFIASSGLLQRSTSSLKYKTEVQDATHGLADILKLRSVTYKGKTDGETVFGGLIAEEVHEAGLTEFVQYAEDGSPDALAYGQMVSLCVKAIQEQQALITTLTERITALEAK